MKKRIILILFIIQGLIFPSARIFTQIPGNDSTLFLLEIANEKIHVFTDRSMYAVGEKIYFRVYNLSHPRLKETGWSKIIYIELIDAGHTSFANGKFALENWGASGYIIIPETVPTGNYYLRVYTKWMRNYSPSLYSYSKVKIINPYKEELNVVEIPNTNKYISSETVLGKDSIINDAIQCFSGQNKYEKRKKATLKITLPDNNRISPDGYCLSVIKSGAIDSYINGITVANFEDHEKPEEVKYYPETKGMSLSGKVIRKDQNIPSSHAEVHLSILGDQPEYFGYLTNEKGQFFFSLPHRNGVQNLYIGVETKDDHPVDILIDNDFSTEMIDLQQIPFILSEDEKRMAREIMFNMQLQKAFRQTSDSNSVSNKVYPKHFHFYGEPSVTIVIDDYIELPTLEEFFYELIPEVVLMRRKEQVYFVIQGNHSDLAIYKPLVLLDMVPVSDINSLLRIPPDRIHHIEVINATYVRGNMCFGGIISVFSHKRDLAGIDLPTKSYFFDFKTYEPQQEIRFPDYSDIKTIERTPDFRNCMYWNPNVRVSPGESISINFYTSDNQGEYTILIRGISAEGIILEGRSTFVVE